jgi:NADH-quinone oxidoreductase subunit H
MDPLAALAGVDWLGAIIKLVVMVLLFTFVLVTTGFVTYFERKALAHAQQRYGPNRTGPLGLLQWIADALKMVTKEFPMPAGADRWVFVFAPVMSAFAATAMFAFIPFGQANALELFGRQFGLLVGETPIGLIGLLALSSLGVYGLIMAGWGSNNKYALLGGLRAGAQVISYEITMGISLVGVLLLAQSFNLNDIARAQGVGAIAGAGFDPSVLSSVAKAGQPGLWFILLQPVAFLTYLLSGIAEANRLPFDMPEAEGELVAGYHVEYGAMGFGAFMFSEFLAAITISCIATYCFLGGWQSPIPGLYGGLWEPFWFVLKAAGFVFFFFALRFTLPRIRYDQVMGLTWKVLLPVVLVNIAVVSVMKALMLYGFSGPPPVSLATLGQSWPWLIFVAVELALCVVVLYAYQRVSTSSYVGRSERPILVANPRPETLLAPPA